MTMTCQYDQTVFSNQAAKTVLVVEDDIDLGTFFVKALEQETPYQVLLAADCFRAIEIMQRLIPSLIVLDYLLPRMNGIDFYDALKAFKEFARIPILLVSARVPVPEVQQRNIAHLKKPVDIDELLSSIEKLLS